VGGGGGWWFGGVAVGVCAEESEKRPRGTSSVGPLFAKSPYCVNIGGGKEASFLALGIHGEARRQKKRLEGGEA